MQNMIDNSEWSSWYCWWWMVHNVFYLCTLYHFYQLSLSITVAIATVTVTLSFFIFIHEAWGLFVGYPCIGACHVLPLILISFYFVGFIIFIINNVIIVLSSFLIWLLLFLSASIKVNPSSMFQSLLMMMLFTWLMGWVDSSWFVGN